VIKLDGAYLWTERFQPLRPYTPPADVLDIFRRELDAAHAEDGLFQLVMHPHVIGYRSRIWILEEIVRHAKALGSVWFATHRDVAAWSRANGGAGRELLCAEKEGNTEVDGDTTPHRLG